MKESGTDINLFKNTVGKCSQEVQTFVKKEIDAGKSAKDIAAGMKETKSSFDAATIVIKAFNAALSMLATAAISWAIGKIVEGLDNYIHRAERAKEASEEFLSEFKNTQSTLQSHKDTVDELSSEYTRLSQGVDELGNNVSLSNEDFQKYRDICNQIADLYPELVTSWTKEGDAVVDLRGKVETLTEAYKAEKQAALEAFVAGASDVTKSYKLNADHSAQIGMIDSSGALQKIAALEAYIEAMEGDKSGEKIVDLMENGGNGFSGYDLQNILKELDIKEYEGDIDALMKYLHGELKLLHVELNSEVDSMRQALLAMMQLDGKELSDEAYQVGAAIVNKLDEGFFSANSNAGDLAAFSEELVASLATLTNQQAKTLYDSIFNIDDNTKDMTTDEYVTYLINLIAKLQSLTGLDENKIKVLFGIEEDGTAEDYVNEALQRAANRLDGNPTTASDISGLMTRKDIDYINSSAFDQERYNEVKSKVLDAANQFTQGDTDGALENLKRIADECAISFEDMTEAVDFTDGISFAELLKMALEAVKVEAEEAAEASGKLAMSEEELTAALAKIGVSDDSFKQYVADLQALYPELARDEEAAKRYALSNQQIANATSDLRSNLEGYLDTINSVADTEDDANRAGVEYMTALRSIADDLSNLFGREFTLGDAETFIRSAENADMLKAAIEGDTEAFQRLQAQMAQPVVAQIMADAEINLDDFNAQYQSFCEWLNGLAPGTILTNADLNANPFFQTLQQMYQEGKLTAEQISELFGSLGYDVDFDWEDITPQYVGNGLSSADAQAEKFAQKAVESAKIRMPTNIHYIQKNQTPTAPKSTGGSSGGSGGSGGGGGGGSSSSPTNDAADAVIDAADSVDDAVQSAADAAMKAFNDIKSIWDKWISDQEHNRKMTDYRKQLADLRGEPLSGRSDIPYGNFWELTTNELQGLADSYNAQANALTAEMNNALATGQIAPGSAEHQQMESAIQSAYESQFGTMVQLEELLAKREEEKTSIIERIADRFGKITDKWGKTVNRMWTWWNKNWAVNKQIQATQKERTKQEKVEKRYNKDLKRIGLDKKYARAIKNDTLDVSKIKDGFLLERIEKYQDLYDKIRDCQDAQRELFEQERELIKSKLENIVTYFDDIQKYYDSIAGKLDSLQSVKDAAGQKRSLTDILDQYANAQDSYKNASEALWTYQTGINKNDIRSSDEVAADLGIDNLYDTKYYQQLKAKNDRLLQKQQDYQDKMDEIADLREELADATSKKEKKRIKKEIKTAKKEAKTLKLTKGQKKTLTSTTNTLTGAAEVSGGKAGMEETYASATYQQLLKQIGTLKNKKKLSSKDKKTLKMYEEELAAINEGVLVGNIATFRTKFEQLWKLQNKGKSLTRAEEKTKAALEKSLASISDAYADYIKQLTDEYNNALIAEGKSEADLEANYKQTREDTEASFDEQMKDLTDQSGTATVKNIQANIDKWQDWLDKGKNSKGKKLTDKQKKEYQQKILAAQAKLKKLAQIPVENVARASTIYDWLKKHQSKYDANKLTKKERETWDKYTAELNGYISKQNEAVTELEKERDDALKELDNNYDTQLNELEERKNERLAQTYEYAKETADLAIKNAEAVIDMLSDQIDQYKAVAELLQDTSLENLKSYGILDFLGLYGNDSTAMLRSQLTSGIQSATEKIQATVNKGNLLKKLIAAGYSGNFENVLLANASGVDAGYIETLRTMAEQLEEGGYTHEQWIEEWEKELSKVTSELTSATKQVQEFKDELRENVLFKATNDAIAATERLKNTLSSMQSIIRDEWTTDINGMTTLGAAKVNEYAQSWKAAQENVAQYARRLQEIDAAQSDPTRYGYANEQDYLNARNEAIQKYYAAVQEGENAAQAIYEIGKKAREQEINQLKELVNAHKDALKSKKELYEYDKQHKAAQKTVDELRAQVEALNDVSDAASKAKKRQLLSDLKDAEDALTDLETEHKFDLSETALDDFIANLEDTLDTSNQTLKETFEEFTKIVEETMESAKGISTAWESDKLVSYFGLGDKSKILSDYSMTNPASLAGANEAVYTPVTPEEFTSGISSVNVNLAKVEAYLSTIDTSASKIVESLSAIDPNIRTIVDGLDYSLDLTMNWENLLNVEGSLDAVSTERLMSEMGKVPGMITSQIYQMISKAGLKKKYR